MKSVIVIHYGELALKGKNRSWFEQRLQQNIQHALSDTPIQIERLYGRMIISSHELALLTKEQELSQRLQAIPGIANFSFSHHMNGSYEDIEQAVLSLLEHYTFHTFAIDAHRVNKQFPLDSMQVNKRLGAAVVHRFGSQVQLKDPEMKVSILITSEGQYITFNKQQGRGGLPYGTSGSVLSLLSSGIDSPVASNMLLHRGARMHYIHFHSYPMTSQESIDNVHDIVRQLHQFQPAPQLFMAPLATIQKQIVTDAPSSYRVIMYRRAMFQIAERIAERIGAHALITGESLGQVASQTLQNMSIATHHISMPILRPLIGFDKQEIIDRAKLIGTYDISTRPYEDCCSLLVPERVETAGSLKEVELIESHMAWNERIEEVMNGIEEV